MAGLPTIQVLLDDGTGTFPFDITAKCRLAYDVKRGRQDELSSPTPGELKLTVDNTDGRFTPGSTIIASPSPIKNDQRIRVKVTANAVTVNRFTGYVQSWPVVWPTGAQTLSEVTITATDAQARAERCVLRSVIEEEIYTDSPTFIYPLQEAAEATGGGDTSGNQHAPLQNGGSGASALFGDTSAGWVGAKFANGKYLTNGESITVDGTTTATFVAKFRTSTSPGGANIGSLFGGPAQSVPTPFGINGATGGSLGSGLGGGLDTSPTLVIDGNDHVAILTISAGSATLYLDGVSFGSAAINPSTFFVRPGDGYTGVLSYLGLYPTALSAARVAAISQALLNGFAGETGVARLTRLAGYAKVPLGTLDPSLTLVSAADLSGKSAGSCMQEVADAEMGIIFTDGSGNEAFHNRQKVTTKSAPDITIDANQLDPGTSFVTDMQGVINYIEVTAQGTQVLQVVRSATSETSHGRYPQSQNYLVTTDQDALDRANWVLAAHAEPSARVGQLAIDMLTLTAAQQAQLLAAEADTWIRIQNLPSQTPGGTTADLVIQGFQDVLSAANGTGPWVLTANVVSKSTIFPSVWILGDATFGVLGSTTRLGV